MDTSNMTAAELEAAQEAVFNDVAQKMAEVTDILNRASALFKHGYPDNPVPLASTFNACRAYVAALNTMNGSNA